MDPEAAVEVRRDLGIPVHTGSLETAPYAYDSFDAVILSHVIEHVHDPIGLLQACRGFLNPGGVLIAITPNTASCIHRRFGADWLGLDPPRHLHLFNRGTLQRIAEQAGFQKAHTWTTAARASFGAIESRKLQIARDRASGVEYEFSPYGTEPPLAWALWVFWQQYYASVRGALDRDAGDECVLRAVK
jgi:SAM-dependent methyltransferase